MKTLLLIRHAKSSWDDASLPDFDRTLNARGLHDAGEMPVYLSARIKTIDAFISSPAKRAKKTAEKFAAVFNTDKEQIIFEQGLYLAPASFFETLLAKMNDQFASIAVFSHNPGITEFANTLTSAVKTDNMPTCSIFAVSAPIDKWKDFSGAQKQFLFFDYPKLHV